MNAKKALVLSMVASAAATLSGSCRAQEGNFEVLGIALGSPADAAAGAVKLPGAQTFVQKGTLSMGSFTSQPMIFGEDLTDGPDSTPFTSSFFHIDKEYIRLVFDLRTPQKVDYIKRVRIFSQDTNPSFDSLKSSLIEKYGQPLYGDVNKDYPVFLWNRNSQIPYAKRDLASPSCASLLLQMSYLARGSYGGSAALDTRVLPRCGSWMEVRVSRASYNPALVAKIEIDAGDLSEIAASTAFLQNQLRSGATGAAAKELQHSQRAPL